MTSISCMTFCMHRHVDFTPTHVILTAMTNIMNDFNRFEHTPSRRLHTYNLQYKHVTAMTSVFMLASSTYGSCVVITKANIVERLCYPHRPEAAFKEHSRHNSVDTDVLSCILFANSICTLEP